MPHESRPTLSFHQFLWRVFVAALLTLALIGIAVFLWYAAQALLLGFAGILLAVMLTSLAGLLQRVISVGPRAALALVVLFPVLLASVILWFLAPSILYEMRQMSVEFPKSIQEVHAWSLRQQWIQELLAFFPLQPASQVTAPANVAGQITNIFSATYVILLEVLMVLFMGIALAAEPYTYVEGGLLLLPVRRRKNVRSILEALHTTLQRWIAGQFLSMVTVAILTFIGLFFLHFPLAFSLSLIAGLLDFIPTIGPILGAIPALLIAVLQGPFTVFSVILLYILVHLIEGYLLMPFIHRRTVYLPPVITVIVLLVLGFLLGPLGLLLATPITASVIVLIKMLYMENVLNEDVSLPGQN